MLALFDMPGASVVFFLLLAVLGCSVLVTVLALLDFIVTLRKRRAFYEALGAGTEAGSPWAWSLAYGLSSLCISFGLLLIFLFRPSLF